MNKDKDSSSEFGSKSNDPEINKYSNKYSKEWHPNAPLNTNAIKGQPQPESTPDPDTAKPSPPIVESDDSIEHTWRATDAKTAQEKDSGDRA